MVRKSYLLLIFILSIALVFACNEKKNDAKQVSHNKVEKVLEETKKVLDVTESSIEKVEDIEVEKLPLKSQQTTNLPWDGDNELKEAQKEHGAHILIAGYVTVSEEYSPEELENIKLAASIISGSVVMPGEVFSQNAIAGPYTEEKGYKEGEMFLGGKIVLDFGGGVCNVSTTLYNTSIASDLEIVERHNHSMPVPYVPYGQDAAVAYGYKDFKFKNTTDDPILIWAELIGNRLYIGFYGTEVGPKVTWEHETIREVKTTTKYRINPNLNEGEENILVNGMDGRVVESVLKIKGQDGKERIKKLGKSEGVFLTLSKGKIYIY